MSKFDKMVALNAERSKEKIEKAKLRQGFGRAIRTGTDTCVVSILDDRAAPGGRYHQAVLEALPECRMTEQITDVEQFIRERKGIEYYM